jgi:nucleotide-binding universal stress UspA family protein
MTDDDTGVVHSLEVEQPSGPPPRVILVGVDFSASSRGALAWALDFARVAPCHLHTVHVVERRWRLSDLRSDLDTLRAELVDVHDAAVAELGPLVDVATRASVGSLHEHVVLGDPAPEIVALAQELGAELIVVGSHGGDARHRLLVGSVASRVVRDAPCPVVVVPASKPA